MKGDDLLYGASPLFEIPPAPVDEDSLDEILPEDRVVEAAVLLNGEQRESRHEGAGEDSHPLFHGHAALAVDLDRSHP
jgi:hypothetical protein